MKNDTHDQVLAEIIKGIGYITLNRPAALNTINLPMVKTIHQALLSWANDPNVKAIVIKGDGEKAFCAGGDVRRVYECIKLDSSEYEQQRQITMKASSISLLYALKPPQLKVDEVPDEQQHLINLTDSPGHVDFSVEVGSAVTLSDGALVLIDCVEGVSP